MCWVLLLFLLNTNRESCEAGHIGALAKQKTVAGNIAHTM